MSSRIEQIIEQQTYHGRRYRSDDYHEAETSRRIGIYSQPFSCKDILYHCSKLFYQINDVLPVNYEYRYQSAEMQKHCKRKHIIRIYAEKVLQKRQMSRTADG